MGNIRSLRQNEIMAGGISHATFCRNVWSLVMSFVVLSNVIVIFSSLVGPRYHTILYGQGDISNQDPLLSHSCMRQARSCSDSYEPDFPGIIAYLINIEVIPHHSIQSLLT